MKIDYLVMGHRMPHLHCHLLPQHADDDPLRNPDISDGPVVQTARVFTEAAAKYARAWTDPQ